MQACTEKNCIQQSSSERSSPSVEVSSTSSSLEIAQSPTAKSIQLTSLPYSTVVKAFSLRSDVDALLMELELDHPALEFSREDARRLIEFAVGEQEKDRLAPAPATVEPLERKINRALSEEVDRIQTEMTALQKISALPEGSYKGKHSQEVFTPETARDRLVLHTKRLLEIKKLLVDQRKADTAAKQGNVMNMQLNLGDVISDALSSIKKAEEITIHASNAD